MYPKISLQIVWIVLIALLLGGCSARPSDEVRISEAESGGKVELNQGQVLSITLESNMTTGYSWGIAELPEHILAQDGESIYSHPTGDEVMPGAGGYETLRFEAVNAGQGTLRLEYRQPWETEVAPDTVFMVDVVVK